MKKTVLAIFMIGLLVTSLTSFGQDQKITGIVTDPNGAPIESVSVTNQSTKATTLTNALGAFSIGGIKGQRLLLTHITFGQKEIVIGSGSTLNISMEQQQNTLNDVVVVGYGTQRKANLTGAVTTVDVNKTFGSRPLNDPAKALQGVVPGLTIQYGNGGLTAGPSINIRGIGSINGSSRPLILVDNVETQDLSIINPNDIESISVLKDAASTSIYGARAAFGVVLIKTKTGKKNQKLTV
ncbi:MAG: TonB-dependent receptor plug domain-containing protein, partial [Chitinophagaceae bacterium]